jgi:uncharacterized protein (TIGR02001 family)
MSHEPRPLALALALCAVLAAPLAHAGSCGGALGLSSENIYRGISLSEGRRSAFGDVHCAFAQNWVAGIGANTVQASRNGADTQFTVYLDRRWRLDDDWSAKLGVIHYEPFHADNRAGFQYDELNAAIGWRGRWLSTLAWGPRVGNAYIGGPAGYNGWLYIETAWRQPLGGRFSLDAGLGYAHPSASPPHDYHYANLALNAAIGDAYLSLSRVWTRSLNFRYNAFDPPFEFTFPSKQRWVGSVVWMY